MKGKDNGVADALSRRPDHALNAITRHSTTTTTTAITTTATTTSATKSAGPSREFTDLVIAGYAGDAGYEAAHGDEQKYIQIGDLLYFKHEHGIRLYVPDHAHLREILLREHHDVAGHLGRHKNLESLQRHFYWPCMKKSVTAYIKTCVPCQRNKASNQKPAGLLQPLAIPMHKWESISMDFVVALPVTKNGYDAIMTVVDRLTKMVHFVPTRVNATAADVAALFFDEIVCLHGLPKDIVTDRDPKFTSELWTTLWNT